MAESESGRLESKGPEDRGRYGLLLVALIGFIVLFPVLAQGRFGVAVLQGFFTVILVAAVSAFQQPGAARRRPWLLAALAIGLFWTSPVTGNRAHAILSLALMFGVLVYTTVRTLGHVARIRRVTADSLYGAACAYLLLGLVFAFLYGVLKLLAPGSLGLPERLGDTLLAGLGSASRFHEIVYFSLVTLSTLGYGDISPVSPMARGLAPIEAVIGQLYLAVLVARLVALYIAQEEWSRRNE